ncbi:MAG: IS630 family transposase [Chloroflexi bacterium]|nr:IS630 family transposase [Chloroflexota bacterium]
MVYVRDPLDEEIAELKHMTRHAIGRVSQRAQMVLLSAQHRTVPELATIFDLHPASVRFWLRRFDSAGPAGLLDAPRSGRPREMDAANDQRLVQLLAHDPQNVPPSEVTTTWTVAMLTLALILRTGHYLSRATVRAALQRLGWRWGRPRLTMPRKVDPDKALKQWRIAAAVLAAGPEAAVLYADESRIALLPLVRGLWQWVGQQVRIPTPGSNETRSLFGALEIRTGQWTYLVRETMKKEDFIAFLEHLLTVYSQGAILLIVDNYSSHTAGEVRDWLAKPEHARLQLHFLPKQCSHLNPVEPIWLRLKAQVAANRLHGSMRQLLATVDTFFDAMTPEQALQWAG